MPEESTTNESVSPQQAARPRALPGMLPGMALIAMYLLLIAMLNAFAAINNKFNGTPAKYSVLGVCTLLLVGVFGFLRLKRWGWALVTVGCLLMGAGYFYAFARTHIPPYVVQGLFDLVFFLYLVRPDVRERLR